jgi:nicotinate-nucleotide pyrophosphorylase (carboxylating)
MPASPQLQALIDLALIEDLGSGDLTSEALFSGAAEGRAWLVARQPLVVSGLPVAGQVFSCLDAACRLKALRREGTRARRGQPLAEVRGPLRALLAGERTALNFVQRLSGIATSTRRYAEALRGTDCTLLDTRKTTPGWRSLEKAAVRAGGGRNHRMGLFDGVMIKDNHIRASGSLARAVERARRRAPPTVRIEVECDTLRQVRAALRAGADIIMLDNMSPERLRRAVEVVAGRAWTEASGGIDLDTIRRVAETGVDYVSVGALTHSAPAVDVALDLE